MRLGSALAGPFSRQAREPGGGGGWYLLCPAGTKLVRALYPGVLARARSRPVAAASSGRRPGCRAPASLGRRCPAAGVRPLRFWVGSGPPGAARRPHAQHGSTPRLSGRESRTTASVELRLPGGDIRYQAAPGSPAGGGQGPSHVLVDVSRTEPGIYTDRSGGFVRWHPACVSLDPFANHPSAPSRESSFQQSRKRPPSGGALSLREQRSEQ
jgi:hypothetical protein